jgi:hypothetical protein
MSGTEALTNAQKSAAVVVLAQHMLMLIKKMAARLWISHGA